MSLPGAAQRRRGRMLGVGPAPRAGAAEVDVAALEAELSATLRGEVRFGDGDRALWAADASNYRQPPIGVVLPRDVEDIVEAVRIAHRHGAPVLPRGGGTSLGGQCCNHAVVIDTSKYVNDVLEVNAKERWARVQPGTILDDLRDAAGEHGLTYGPDPATHNHCVLGGMIGNNSCGIHSVMAEFYGPGPRTEHQVLELEVLTYDGVRMRVGPTAEDELERIIAAGGRKGEIYRDLRDLRDRYAEDIRTGYPDILRRVSGYNLYWLLPENGFNVARALVGTEGTCVFVLEARVTLIENPRARSLVVMGYDDVYDAASHVTRIRDFKPIGLEGIDDNLINDMKEKGLRVEDLDLLPDGNGWLLVEFRGDTKEEADTSARACMAALEAEKNPPAMRLYDDDEKESKVWEVRESGLGATAFIPGDPDTWPGWEDSAVPVDSVAPYLRDLRQLFDKYGYQCSLYGHFGQGCIHTRIDFDLTSADGIERYQAFTREAAELVVHKYGGSLSGEHGDGQARGDLLDVMYGPRLVQAFRDFKRTWDPDWKMNPGKVVDPYARVQNLRLGEDYAPWTPETHFSFPQDQGSFAHATLRCVGVGKCRRKGGGTMCPSYQVTMEEKDTTRGRAHLLFEMLQGEVITDGWKSEEVKDSLDLCLACKGCKGDCPVNVDIATYKAEFLSHYYEGRLRPRYAYAFGLIMVWARIAKRIPRLVNFLTHAPGLKRVAHAVAGITPERQIPMFADHTFRDWFGERAPVNQGHVPVILWPDTFNNHFFPETLIAATEVLESAGFQVIVPKAQLCCGRPLYDYGMLDLAKRFLERIVDELRPAIRSGVRVVGLEPSCTSVFRDELIGMLPHDEDAKRLRDQTCTLAEFLTERAPESFSLPNMEGMRAIVHGHCHHKAIMKMGPEKKVLNALGLDFEELQSGCCGLAGSFGFEQGHYDVSMAIGEQVLLPAARNADRDTVLVADGFSCREQVMEGAGRRPLHLAELIRLGMNRQRLPAAGEPPERRLDRLTPPQVRRSTRSPAALAIGVGATLALAGGITWLMKRNGKDR